MKTLLKLFAFVSIIILIAIGCQKILSNDDLITSGEGLSKAVVKNWYYGTFVKTPEWAVAAKKDKQLPDWKNGVITTIDKQAAVVYPFIKGQHAFLLPGDKSLTESQCKRIADASLSKIAFIKTADNKITVREIDYIPDWQYLQNKKFNIGEMKGGNGISDFSGRVITRDWAGNILSIQIQVDGKTVKIGRRVNEKEAKSTSKGGDNTSSLEGCTYTTLCLWQQDCVITIYGDGMITNECGEWYIVECWEVENCPDPPPGGGGGGGPIDPPDPCEGEETCASKDSKVQNTFDNGIIGSDPSTAEYGPIVIIDSRDKSGPVTRQTWKGVGWFSSFILKARFNCTYTLRDGINSHSLIINDYKWKSCNFSMFEKEGAPFGYDIEADYIESPYTINGNDASIFPQLKYQLAITYGCCGFTQPQYKEITDALVLQIKLVN